MSDRASIDRTIEEYFENLWKAGDPWRFESSECERQKYARQLELLSDRRYGRVLEIGCAAGVFTRMLATLPTRL
ncbi:MAG: SAM-dependent methyltransferase [Gemmatimonadaceae bacterium]